MSSRDLRPPLALFHGAGIDRKNVVIGREVVPKNCRTDTRTVPDRT